MASEDSDQVLPGFPVVHGLRDFGDLDQSLRRQMSAALADLDAFGELFEITSLRSAKRICLEERNDHPKEILPPAHDVAIQVLLVVVMPTIDTDGTDPKEALHRLQHADTAGALDYDETVSHLISGLVAFSTLPAGLPNEADGEASLSVYKTNNPVSPNRPFLLIFRTVRIVTAHERHLRASTGRILGFSSI
jgi:hypothetical protein